MREVIPGVFRWTADHPAWSPEAAALNAADRG
jgi:hypothetical protein